MGPETLSSQLLTDQQNLPYCERHLNAQALSLSCLPQLTILSTAVFLRLLLLPITTSTNQGNYLEAIQARLVCLRLNERSEPP